MKNTITYKNYVLGLFFFVGFVFLSFHANAACEHPWESCGGNYCCPCPKADCFNCPKPPSTNCKEGCNTCACMAGSCWCGDACSPADGLTTNLFRHAETGEMVNFSKKITHIPEKK